MGFESFDSDSYAPYAGSVAETKKVDEAKNASETVENENTIVIKEGQKNG